ncbi:MAG: type II secretion system protein [Cyanobacteria bacterium SIG32]|nr:type II secretion system protein [Cyanobacteria bacterium SIG32]
MKKTVKNLITWSPSHLITSQKSAFTLAEVLITLAIIGVVAAMTIPTLTANYQKNLITSRMLKFYSSMKQAVQLASVDGLTENITYEKSGEKILEWYNKNLAKHLRTNSVKTLPDGILVSLLDGSGFITLYGGHTIFCPEYKKCEETINSIDFSIPAEYAFVYKLDGKNLFGFLLWDGVFKTYDTCWDGTKEGALYSTTCEYGANEYGCADKAHKLCAKLIEINGWKIPDDYPIKF